VDKLDKIPFPILEAAAFNGTINKLPIKKLTLESLLQPNASGDSILHIAAKTNKLSSIPKQFLTTFSTLIENMNGETIIHIAAKNGRLCDIPIEHITQEAIDNVTLDGESIIHRAAAGGCLDKIPKGLLTTKEMSRQDQQKETPLHHAGKYGTLNTVPKEFLTLELLSICNNLNETVVHSIAYGDNLKNLPEEVLTPQMLRSKDKHNSTPIQNATRTGKLRFLLDKLKDNDYTWEDNDNDNLLHLAAISNSLHEIPSRFLTQELLLKKNINNENPLDITIRNLEGPFKVWAEMSLKTVIPNLSTTTLQEFLKTAKKTSYNKVIKSEIVKRKILARLSKEKTYIEL
jgi:ankyrin repeat protein